MEKKDADIVIYTTGDVENLERILNTLHTTEFPFDFNILIQNHGSQKIVNLNKYPKVERYVWQSKKGNKVLDLCVSPIIIKLDDTMDIFRLNLLACMTTRREDNKVHDLVPKDIDVCVTTYNRKTDLEAILNALNEQKGVDFNVIVNDDGSKELIEPHQFPVLNTYLWAKDIGFTKVARVNESVLMCPSDNILLLDGDAIPVGYNFLQKHVNNLRSMHVSYGRALWFDKMLVCTPANMAFQKKNLIKSYGLYPVVYNGHYGHEDTDVWNEIRYLQLTTVLTDATVKLTSQSYSAENMLVDIKRNHTICKKRWGGWRNFYWRKLEKLRNWYTGKKIDNNTN